MKRKATASARDPVGGSEPVEYQIVFAGNPKYSQFGVATLCSKLLDKRVHGGQEVAVIYSGIGATYGPDHPPPRIALDSFEIHSLEEYLRNQARYRRLVEAAVDAHLDGLRHGRGGIRRGPAMWSRLKVMSVSVRPRHVPTRREVERHLKAFPARLASPHFSKRDVDERLAAGDTPDTRSRFQVHFQGQWPDEHARTAEFRDGELLRFGGD